MKAYTVTKEIRGKEYTAQFSGLSTSLRAVDSSYVEGTNNTSIEKLATFIFKHVIVQPSGLDIDDFDDMEEFNEVVTFGREVMQGKFRDEQDTETAKGTGKK